MPDINNFFLNEKILFLARVIAFLNLKNTYNYIVHANFNRDFLKMNFKIYLLMQFLTLGSCVRGTKNTTSKFKKLYEKIDFKVNFWGIATEVCVRNVIVCISKCANFG